MSSDPTLSQNTSPDQTDSQAAMPETAVPQTVRPFNYSSQTPVDVPTDPTAKGTPSMKASKIFFPLCAVVIVAGVLTGLGLNKLYAKGAAGTFQGQTIQTVAKDAASIQNNQVFGS